MWDFRGPDAKVRARQELLRLQEYMVNEELDPRIAGQNDLSPRHSMIFMIVPQHRLEEIRLQLNPHRGQCYEMV